MMTKEKLAALRAAAEQALARTHELAATGDDLTPAERAELDQLVAECTGLAGQLKQGRHDLSIIDQGREMSAAIGLGDGGAGGPLKGRRLSFKGGGMARQLAEQIRPGGQQKALSPSGSAVVGQTFVADPVALGKPALSLLDVVDVIEHSTPEFAYLRESTRTNNAAVVAPGALKPTSVYSVTRIENSLQVIAHLSEGIPRHWLLDNASLTTFLDSELNYGLQTAVEAKLLADINATSGIQSQVFATSVLASLRKAITKAEIAGLTAASYVMHPVDFEGVELALSSVNAVEHQGLPYNPAARTLYGVAITTSNAQTAGVAHLLAAGAVALDVDARGVDVQYSENATADSFGKNLVFARCEGRYAVSVFSPLGVVKIALS